MGGCDTEETEPSAIMHNNLSIRLDGNKILNLNNQACDNDSWMGLNCEILLVLYYLERIMY